MQKEIVERFLDKNVKLVQKDNFALYGRILEVTNDSIIFRSTQHDSVISLDFIASIVER